MCYVSLCHNDNNAGKICRFSAYVIQEKGYKRPAREQMFAETKIPAIISAALQPEASPEVSIVFFIFFIFAKSLL